RMPPPGLSLAVLLGLLGASLAFENRTRFCQPAPPWQVGGGRAPMEEALGNVTVVALLKAQLTPPSLFLLSMGSLQERLARMGAPDVRFIIVNEKSPQSRALHGELELHAPPGVPVYGQPELGPDIWSILGGAKDDFLIYDRCGRLTFHIRLPFSFLHFPYVESAIRFTHRQDSCGNCSFYPAQVSQATKAHASSPGEPLDNLEVHSRTGTEEQEGGRSRFAFRSPGFKFCLCYPV
uniref:Selenoprotein P N-terminal domain-containing protein n=1 Tax=Monodelphis domestica TaxID=13616 RepID=K7E6A4_MONDO